MRVLAIEDDASLGAFLKANLPSAGFAVDVAETGAQGAKLSRINDYDLVLLDLNLPDMRGEEVMGSLCARERTVPVLALTVIADADAKIRLLNAGADDYLVKPFVFGELVARMRALLRRPAHVIPDVLSAGTLELDARSQSARRKGRELRLTRKEFALLEYLLRRKGSVVSKAELVEHAWDSSANAFSSSIDTHLANLRRKLGSPDVIETIHARGYRISS